VSLAGGSGFGATQQARPEATDGSQGGEAAAPDDPGSSAAAARARGSWKQLVFAWLLLLFAADGLRHRWKSTFRSESAAAAAASRMKPSSKIPAPSSTAPRQEPFGRYQAGGDEDGGGGLGGMHTFGTAFLPPTCQDPVSGRTMAVWATPAWRQSRLPAARTGAPAAGRGGEDPGARRRFDCAPPRRLSCETLATVMNTLTTVARNGMSSSLTTFCFFACGGLQLGCAPFRA